jgi:hypothetical protein
MLKTAYKYMGPVTLSLSDGLETSRGRPGSRIRNRLQRWTIGVGVVFLCITWFSPAAGVGLQFFWLL